MTKNVLHFLPYLPASATPLRVVFEVAGDHEVLKCLMITHPPQPPQQNVCYLSATPLMVVLEVLEVLEGFLTLGTADLLQGFHDLQPGLWCLLPLWALRSVLLTKPFSVHQIRYTNVHTHIHTHTHTHTHTLRQTHTCCPTSHTNTRTNC